MHGRVHVAYVSDYDCTEFQDEIPLKEGRL